MQEIDQPIDMDEEDRQLGYCTWHPAVQTGLSCGKCERGICSLCLVHAPVGVRCPECGKATKVPAFEVKPNAYAKAVVVGVVVAICGGALWSAVNLILISLGLVIFASVGLPALAVGYAAGELVNAAVNAKRNKSLAYIAGGSVVGAFIFAQILYSGSVGFMGLIVLAIAMYMAVQRVK